MIGALNVILQQRGLVLACAGTSFLIVVAALALKAPTYSSTSSFMPESRRSTPSISGLAAQFGLYVAGGEPGQSPAFYSDLVLTRQILGAVVDSRYSDSALGNRDSVTLVDVIGKGPRTLPLRREEAIRKVRQSVTADVSLKTGVVELKVASRYPGLAKQINQKILDLVNEFNLEKRQSQAAFERRFVERRLEDVRLELRAAEDRLQTFLQRNRDYRNSPELTFEHDRLERDVGTRQQIYTSLALAFEQARIDEVRDNPVITVIEQPTAPLTPEGRGFVGKGILALIGGFLLGLLIAFGRYAIRHGLAGSAEELSRFRVLARDAVHGIPRPWRLRGHSST